MEIDNDTWRESIKKCLRRKVSKKAVFIAFTVIGLPLLVTGIKVWSKQESDYLRYAEKIELAQCEKRLTKTEVIAETLARDIEDIKDLQTETRNDLKEVLRYLRK